MRESERECEIMQNHFYLTFQKIFLIKPQHREKSIALSKHTPFPLSLSHVHTHTLSLSFSLKHLHIDTHIYTLFFSPSHTHADMSHTHIVYTRTTHTDIEASFLSISFLFLCLLNLARRSKKVVFIIQPLTPKHILHIREKNRLNAKDKFVPILKKVR